MQRMSTATDNERSDYSDNTFKSACFHARGSRACTVSLPPVAGACRQPPEQH